MRQPRRGVRKGAIQMQICSAISGGPRRIISPRERPSPHPQAASEARILSYAAGHTCRVNAGIRPRFRRLPDSRRHELERLRLCDGQSLHRCGAEKRKNATYLRPAPDMDLRQLAVPAWRNAAMLVLATPSRSGHEHLTAPAGRLEYCARNLSRMSCPTVSFAEFACSPGCL